MRDQTALPTKLGKYEIRTLLGKGSMGMVFLARDPVLERDVAIKIMGGSSAFDENMRERFEREAKAVGQLHHTNIVTVHDLGYSDQELPFIAMELLEGSDLDELIEHDRLTLSQKLDVLAQVCRGLTHAHDNGVVHRDIKPANIFVTNDGTAKIMDFGVARWTQSHQTQSGLVVGTAGYMAPEQISGQRIDGRADVFSVAVVLFEALTKTPLFPGDSLEAIFFATLSKKPPMVFLPDGTELPPIQKILQRGLARHPDKRFSSAAELGGALESFAKQHAGALAPETTFNVRDASSAAADRQHPPTVQLPSPTRSPELTRTMTPRQRPTGRTSRGGKGRRLPLIVASLLTVAVGIGGYILFSARPDTARSHAAPPASTPTTTPVIAPASPEPAPPAVETPSRAEQSAPLIADAALAVSQNRFDKAIVLIEEGERVDPENPRWHALRDQIRTKTEWKSEARNYVRAGRNFVNQGQYANAIDAFQEAMQHDPDSREARAGLDEAIEAQKRSLDAPPTPARQFIESDTEFVSGPSPSNELLGFESQDDLTIKETADPFYPASVIIELEPVDARAGEPYVLRVKIFNEGYRDIVLTSLQLASQFGNKTTGAGQEIPVRAKTIAPRATVVIHEISGTWQEAQNRGQIEATVTLADGGKLIKKLSW